MDDFDFHDLIATEIDRRKLNQLMDDGVLTPEELANAQVVEVEIKPSCDCGVDLTMVDGDQVRCPLCKRYGIISETGDWPESPSA